ncbi:hypothetical protein L195_g043454 [Trifolium pratense]|uniref:Uncharacterized protein n=1 Tax=Trifolium pratense TaxID=57577 RepID=A0A2K3M9B0_TRIPR|nr:hypothetical protein L195_g043454 [Trifolium pratense]
MKMKKASFQKKFDCHAYDDVDVDFVVVVVVVADDEDVDGFVVVEMIQVELLLNLLCF